MWDFKKAVGKNIRSIRESKGISLRTLADIMELGSSGYSYISEVERGLVGISDEQTKRFAEGLGVGLRDIYRGVIPDMEETVAGYGKEERQLVEIVRTLPKETQEYIMSLVQAVAQVKHMGKREQRILSMIQQLDEKSKGIVEKLLDGMMLKKKKVKMEEKGEEKINQIRNV